MDVTLTINDQQARRIFDILDPLVQHASHIVQSRSNPTHAESDITAQAYETIALLFPVLEQIEDHGIG